MALFDDCHFPAIPPSPVSWVATADENSQAQSSLFPGVSLLKEGCWAPRSYLSLMGWWSFPFMKHPCRHLNQTPISERGELHFSLPALNLQPSHGVSNYIAGQTQKCTHKQHETRGVGRTRSNKTGTQDVPGAHLPPRAPALPGLSPGRGVQGALATSAPGSCPHAAVIHRPPSSLLPYLPPPGLCFTECFALN